MIWFTSDQHYFHRSVLKLGKGRPFQTLEEMHETFIKNHNKKVKPNEIVYHLGDFAFKGSKEASKQILTQLVGEHHLIAGNHDKSAKEMLEIGFKSVSENIFISLYDPKTKEKYKVYLSHYPYLPNLWEALKYETETKLKFKKPYNDRYAHKKMKNQGNWLLCGHTHSDIIVKDNMINVGVDANNWTPVSHEKILEIIRGSK